jgi:hypothetical protein
MNETTNETSGEKLPAEEWATRKGMLPEFIERPTRVGKYVAAGRKVNPKHHLFRAAKMRAKWPIGKEVTEAEFDETVRATQAIRIH